MTAMTIVTKRIVPCILTEDEYKKSVYTESRKKVKAYGNEDENYGFKRVHNYLLTSDQMATPMTEPTNARNAMLQTISAALT